MSRAPPADPSVSMAEAAHLSLQAGRLLLASGAETAEVESAATRIAAAYGYEARVLVTYEALIITLIAADQFATKTGRHLPGLSVDLGVISAVAAIVESVEGGALTADRARQSLDAIEHTQTPYGRILTAVALGLTAASLARLFDGSWTIFLIAGVAGGFGTLLRLELGRGRVNLFAVTLAGALVSGLIGGFGARLFSPATPDLCLVAPGMIIVPGVPLINGIRDLIRNHVTLGVARLTSASLIVVTIAGGLWAAAEATGIRIAIASAAPPMDLISDALWSALAAVGFVVLFRVPLRLAWCCLAIAATAHVVRTTLLHLGVDLIPATLCGALVGGLLSQVATNLSKAPAATFAFPSVVAMIPGSYAFRAVVGAVAILGAGPAAAPVLMAQTLALAITTGLIVAAIAVGLAAPLFFTRQEPPH